MAENPPYMLSPTTLRRILEKIKAAATPARFTHEFLATTLGMKGGTPKPVIPFLKRVGFLSGDGTPTDIYKRFRNDSSAGDAAADALRIGYGSLFEINEKAHELGKDALKGIIVQATGLEKGSRVVSAIVESFNILKSHASFRKKPKGHEAKVREETPSDKMVGEPSGLEMNLSYTINLNLPPTTDVAVFNAIFKSLKENLLKK